MSTSDEVSFGQLVGSYRTLRANISQNTLAGWVGISGVAYRNWEIDENKPSAQHLQRLLEVFLEHGLFTPRKEIEEARALWHASKVNVVFDEIWTNALTNTRHRSRPEKKGQVDDTTSPIDQEAAEELHLHKSAYETDQAHTTEENKDMDAKKRNSIQKIGTVVGSSLLLGYQPLSFGQRGSKLHDEEVLAICEVEIPIWWRLYFEGYHAEIRKILPSYLFQLSTMAERPSRYQQRAGNLASQAHQLAFLLAIQKQDFATALMHTQQAFQCGVIAEDFNLQTSALIREGYVYYLVNDPASMLWQYQKAFQHSEKVSPLLQGRTYVGLAKTHAFLKQEQDADHFLGLARDTFPEYPEQDPTYPYTHWDSFTPAIYEVVSYLQLNQPKNAWKVCEKIATTETLRTTHRVELLVREAETSFALGNMDQCCSYVEQAARAALELGSDLRYQQAYNVYLLLRQRWPHEQEVKELAKWFPRQDKLINESRSNP